MHWIFLLFAATGLAVSDPLLSGGGFEHPVVGAQTPITSGGTPLKSPLNQDWAEFTVKPGSEPGFSAGLAHGFARTGKQSLYVSFDRVEGRTARCTLVSRLIPVQGGAKYRAGIWGRNNPEKPLTLDQRAPYLKFIAEFFLADGVANTGDPEIRIQPLPDHRIRLRNRPPLFNSSQWTEFGVNLTAPADAAFVRVTWKIETSREPGATTGIFHLDDASLNGPRPAPTLEAQPLSGGTEPAAKKP